MVSDRYDLFYRRIFAHELNYHGRQGAQDTEDIPEAETLGSMTLENTLDLAFMVIQSLGWQRHEISHKYCQNSLLQPGSSLSATGVKSQNSTFC